MTLRTTDLGMADARSRWIAGGRDRLFDIEEQIATGRTINRPSDNPADAAILLRHDQRLQRVRQFERNAENARLWTSTSDQALQAASNLLGRAKTLAVQAGNDTLGPVENRALANDLRAIGNEMLAVANTKLNGRAVFAGTSATNEAYDSSFTYLGDTGIVERSIDTSETVEVGGRGPDIFGTSNAGSPFDGNVFEVLEALATAIETDDAPAVRTGIESIDLATARVGQAQGRVGAISRQLDAATFRHEGEELSSEASISKIRDVDIAEAVIRLRSAEASYEATLSATARGLSRSLLDFLR